MTKNVDKKNTISFSSNYIQKGGLESPMRKVPCIGSFFSPINYSEYLSPKMFSLAFSSKKELIILLDRGFS